MAPEASDTEQEQNFRSAGAGGIPPQPQNRANKRRRVALACSNCRHRKSRVCWFPCCVSFDIERFFSAMEDGQNVPSAVSWDANANMSRLARRPLSLLERGKAIHCYQDSAILPL